MTRKSIAGALIYFLICTSIIIYASGCGTSGKSSGRKINDLDSITANLPAGSCIVEGIVRYYQGRQSDFDIITDSSGVFYLADFFWIYNTPPFSIKNIFLEGSISMSYVNKEVRIIGTIQNAPSSYYVDVQNPVNIRLYVSKIEIFD